MTLVLLALGVLLAQAAFTALVYKVHDRSIQQVFGRWFGR